MCHLVEKSTKIKKADLNDDDDDDDDDGKIQQSLRF